MKSSAKGEHIICFALPQWEADYLRSTVELMKCASNDNLVLYVDYAYTFSDCLKAMRGKTKLEWKRALGFKKRLRKISGDESKGLYLLTLPPVFPSFVFASKKMFAKANQFNAAFTGYFINKAVKKLGMTNIIGFNAFQPFLGLWWKINNVDFNIYYCYDDFINVPYFKGSAEEAERNFIAQVDLLIVTSDELKRRKQQTGVPAEIVYNGVHFNSFYQYKQRVAVAATQPKTIGYTGSIDNRIDIELLEPVVKNMPYVSFTFAGKIFDKTVYNRLSHYNNVTFIPPVAADEVPKLMSDVQVGIIPYKLNSLTAAIYPLKANEYLAMGLPVVMTPFASIGEADDVIYRAGNSEDFISSLQNAFLQNNTELQEERISIAKKADWQIRAQQLMSFIKTYKTKKEEAKV
ncbi:MAG: glycosyltransferase [Bacteroidota bacterium]|nr:glycosyltransferase [Bacteroidota bacterium]